MTHRPGRALTYPVAVTSGAIAVCLAIAPFADTDQRAALAVVVIAILGYSGLRFGTALGLLPNGLAGEATVLVRRVRNQHRLVSRSWLEITEPEASEARSRATRWLPVYFDPALLTLVESAGEVGERAIRAEGVRLYPSGRARTCEPPGRLLDNPSRPDPDAAVKAAAATAYGRRLLLDAQSTVAAPFAGLLWVYVMDGGVTAFGGATVVAAAGAVWLAAIGGSDPS
ncbi:hypothetical protein [Nocardia arizonensis]|uniref:hypothetical protein n=1 Tax=Nocardia arizonensis TaxID=1141647 RepID=UPI000A6ACE5E|nr:hypothetical protein [Nocardia arizonensis]